MDRNSIIGIILIAGILIVWSKMNAPSEEEIAQQQARRDSIELVQKKQAEIDLLEKEIAGQKEQAKIDSLKAVLGNEYVAETIVEQENEFYTLENDLLILTLSTKGGRPYAVQLKDYQTFDSLPLVLFNGDSTVFGFEYERKYQHENTSNLFFTVDNSLPKNIVAENSAKSITLVRNYDEGGSIEYTYRLEPGKYQVDLNVKIRDVKGITVDNDYIDLHWSYYNPKQEQTWKNEVQYSSLYVKPYSDGVESVKIRKDKAGTEYTTQVKWIGYKDQFFSTAIIAEDAFRNAVAGYTKQLEDSDHTLLFESTIGVPYNDGMDNSANISFYFGPNKFKLLKKNYEELGLHSMVTVGGGIIRWINQGLIINLFSWLSKGVSNYGIIILLLTVIIKMMLLPLTFRSYMSQAKMRVVKPMVDEATAKIPKDKAMERQQATMGIYKKVGVSPMGGCLPMVLQMPILFAMFRFFPASIELRQESFLWAHDLSTYDALISWEGNIPLLSFAFGNHLSIFTLLMTITTILSMKFNSSTQMNDSAMPGMKTMMYIMPVTFLFVLNNFSAALTYYYFLANVITLGQNALFKLFVDEEDVLKKLHAKKAKPKKKSKWQQRIEDMQKMQQQQVKKRK